MNKTMAIRTKNYALCNFGIKPFYACVAIDKNRYAVFFFTRNMMKIQTWQSTLSASSAWMSSFKLIHDCFVSFFLSFFTVLIASHFK